jgi:hypothetical protein
MTDKWDDEEELTNEEIQAAIQMAVGELLNIAAIAADLQSTDQGAEEIYAMCDLVAEYHGIEHARIEVTENSDGSFTSRVRDREGDVVVKVPPKHSHPYTGSIHPKSKLKFRVIDKNSPKDFDDEED